MENQYGITVANKYALFLNEDEDPLEILKQQEAVKATKKGEKTKKGATTGNENEAKPTSNKPSSDKKSEKIDNFSSPVISDDKPVRSKKHEAGDAGVPKEGRPPRENRPRRDQPPRMSRNNAENQPNNVDGSVPSGRTDRPPRRERQDRGGFGSNRGSREHQPERDGFNHEQSGTEQGGFDRSVRDGFSDRPRSERGGLRERRGERFNRGDRSGFPDRSERDGFDGERPERTFYSSDRPPRRGGYRGRRGGDRGGFGPRSERSGFEDMEGHERSGFDRQGDRGGFDRPNEQEEVSRERDSFPDRPEHRGFDEQPDRIGSEDRGAGRESVRRGRGGGRGFGRGRGGYNRPGKREYDRHTEGGIRPPDKRDGAGSHNWGTVVDDMEGQEEDKLRAGSTEGTTWAEQAEQAEAAEKVAAANRDEGEGGRVDTEPEEKVMTLDEWKSLEEAKRAKAEFNIRKPGEGCEDPKWKKMYQLFKKEKPTDDHEEDEEEEEERHGKQKNLLNIDIRFADNPRRGGGGRGGRGGRGRGGRGGSSEYSRGDRDRGDRDRGDRDRGDRDREYQGRGGGFRDDRSGGRSFHKERAPNVADEMDFPSLDKAMHQVGEQQA